MKKNILPYILLLIIGGFTFSSCDKILGDDPESENNIYLKSRDKIRLDVSTIEIDTYIDVFKVGNPDIGSFKESTDYGVELYSIVYETEFQGEKIDASGVVAVPIGEGPFPFLSFQNGTYVLHSEAPSINIPGPGTTGEQLLVFAEIIASMGYVVAMPDYIGFGESEDSYHPYLDKTSAVRSIMDMLRATKELVNNENLDVNTLKDLYITGYSHGGWATLQVQKFLEDDTSGEFDLKASACGAGPYNLLFINHYILNQDSYPMPYFVGYMLNSYTRLGYISNSLSDIINEPYASRIPTLYDGMKDGGMINSELNKDVSEFFTENYVTGFNTDPAFTSVKTTLINNSIDAWNIETPLMLMHGDNDTYVPYQVSRNMYDDMKDLGVSDDLIQLVTFEGSDHESGILPFGIASIKWLVSLK